MKLMFLTWEKISFPDHFATELAPSTCGRQILLTVWWERLS
jgi:hypothetical protein